MLHTHPSFSDQLDSLKSTLTWSETFQLLKPIHIANAAITIVMPRSHRLKLLQTPSSLEYDTSYDASKCTCSIRLPTRVYIPGQQFTVQFAVLCTPKHRTIAAVQLSIEGSTTYRSIASDPTQRNRNAVVWNPFPLATTREHPAPGELDSRNPNIPVAFSHSAVGHRPKVPPSHTRARLSRHAQSSNGAVRYDQRDGCIACLEIAREQVRPAHEIALTSAASALLHRTKDLGLRLQPPLSDQPPLQTPEESVLLTPVSASVSSKLHNEYKSQGLSFAQDDTLHEGDATFEGLLTIDELASRLAGVGLTHKDVGLLTVQAPLDSKRASKDSMVDIQMLISGHDHDIRMDSGYSYDAIDAKDLPVQQRHEQQPSLPSVSQSAGSVPNHHPITDTFNPEHAVPLATVETGVVATKLQSLLNSLANPSSTPLASSHSVMPHTEARHTDIDTSENPASPSASGRSNQIQQIDDLLDALLAFEQDNQFDDSEYDPLMEPATPPDFLAPGIVVPVRSSSTRSSQTQIEGTATLLCISNTPITIGEPSVSFPLFVASAVIELAICSP
ncbi:hypothetical protein BSLG_003680 [Batrachochytrium salamandrivorans]|nr:hypothetical protein BSLG_003680 [Batrachochytrium salamandrivorans]